MPKISYRYKRVATSDRPISYDLMPIIPITISYKNQKINVETLIDSGASMCFCPIEIGQAFGIQLQECPRSMLIGVGGMAEIFLHKLNIELELGKFRFSARVGFGRFDFHGFSFVLGQKDFFENVNILFERKKERIVLYL